MSGRRVREKVTAANSIPLGSKPLGISTPKTCGLSLLRPSYLNVSDEDSVSSIPKRKSPSPTRDHVKSPSRSFEFSSLLKPSYLVSSVASNLSKSPPRVSDTSLLPKPPDLENDNSEDLSISPKKKISLSRSQSPAKHPKKKKSKKRKSKSSHRKRLKKREKSKSATRSKSPAKSKKRGKSKSPTKSKKREKSKSPARSKSPAKSKKKKSQSRTRSKSPAKSKKGKSPSRKERSRSRKRSKTPMKERKDSNENDSMVTTPKRRKRSRSRKKSKSPQRKERSRSRKRSKSPRKERSRSRKRNKTPKRSKSPRKERSRSRKRSKSQRKERSRTRKRSKSERKERSRSQKRSKSPRKDQDEKGMMVLEPREATTPKKRKGSRSRKKSKSPLRKERSRSRKRSKSLQRKERSRSRKRSKSPLRKERSRSRKITNSPQRKERSRSRKRSKSPRKERKDQDEKDLMVLVSFGATTPKKRKRSRTPKKSKSPKKETSRSPKKSKTPKKEQDEKDSMSLETLGAITPKNKKRSRSPKKSNSPQKKERSRSPKRSKSPTKDEDQDLMALVPLGATTPKKRKRSRWMGDENYKALIPGMPTILPTNMTPAHQEAYIAQIQIEELTRKLRSGDFGIPTNPDERSPSPEPVYGTDGKRINTRETRIRKYLEEERHRQIQRLLMINPYYRPPPEYRAPVLKISDRVEIPQEEYPTINFVGLLLGPRGNTLKSLEKETSAKVTIRGKGSVKEGKVGGKIGLPLPGDDEPLHAYVTSTNPVSVKRACDRIKEVIREGIEKPESQNDLRRNQLRELALLNGTLREGEGPKCSNCGSFSHRTWHCPDKPNVTSSITCTICGCAGHISKDCRVTEVETDGIADASPLEKAKIDQEYISLMAELGETPNKKKGKKYNFFADDKAPKPLMSLEWDADFIPKKKKKEEAASGETVSKSRWSNSLPVPLMSCSWMGSSSSPQHVSSATAAITSEAYWDQSQFADYAEYSDYSAYDLAQAQMSSMEEYTAALAANGTTEFPGRSGEDYAGGNEGSSEGYARCAEGFDPAALATMEAYNALSMADYTGSLPSVEGYPTPMTMGEYTASMIQEYYQPVSEVLPPLPAEVQLPPPPPPPEDHPPPPPPLPPPSAPPPPPPEEPEFKGPLDDALHFSANPNGSRGLDGNLGRDKAGFEHRRISSLVDKSHHIFLPVNCVSGGEEVGAASSKNNTSHLNPLNNCTHPNQSEIDESKACNRILNDFNLSPSISS